ncbi:DUF397 domain-containing protein [Streptomyces sp. NPDC018000]|uniref:DUF397 domain-containing protein n=1 Tax=Streptomyces sp. NPDC018000 TaxID=3365028 RepID=UPI00379EDDC3
MRGRPRRRAATHGDLPHSLRHPAGSYSSNDGPDCVEVAETASTIHVRDSKNLPGGPQLGFGPRAWAEFVTYASGN